MKKAKTNLVIDVIMLIIMMTILGIGLLNKFILLSGQEKWEKFGENLDFSLLGLDRHEWGEVHLILGLIFIGLLVLHIILHWNMILEIYHRLIKSRKIRTFTAMAILFLLIIVVSFPLFIKPTVTGTSFKGRNRYPDRQDDNIETIREEFHQEKTRQEETRSREYSRQNAVEDAHHELREEIDIRDSMTLKEVEEEYDIPADHIKRKLEIPVSTSNNLRLGQLRKVHGFNMSEIREIIDTFQKAK